MQWTTIYMLLVSFPPYSFVVHHLDELRNIESTFWVDHFVRGPRSSSHHIYCGTIFSSADRHVQCVYVGRMCRFSLSFPCIEFISFFFIKKPFHIPLLLHYTLSLESETKREFLHFLLSKTHFSLLMVDFEFIRKETPSVSLFFARFGVFLESSGRCCPQVGLFVP